MSRLDQVYIASPYDQPKLVREIVLRILRNEIAEHVYRNTRERLHRDSEHLRDNANRILYGGARSRVSRETAMLVEAFHAAWSIYHMLKEKGIIGDEFDKDIG